MQESDLIYDWNTVEYEFKRDPSNHPHGIWFDDETLRDGLQSPSARNPTIEEKIELLHLMESLGIGAADLGLPGAGERQQGDVEVLVKEIESAGLKIKPNCAARTMVRDIRPIGEVVQKPEAPSRSTPLSVPARSASSRRIGPWTRC